jgi:hypothetical protein
VAVRENERSRDLFRKLRPATAVGSTMRAGMLSQETFYVNFVVIGDRDEGGAGILEFWHSG